jgi:hypothetical protein
MYVYMCICVCMYVYKQVIEKLVHFLQSGELIAFTYIHICIYMHIYVYVYILEAPWTSFNASNYRYLLSLYICTGDRKTVSLVLIGGYRVIWDVYIYVYICIYKYIYIYIFISILIYIYIYILRSKYIYM